MRQVRRPTTISDPADGDALMPQASGVSERLRLYQLALEENHPKHEKLTAPGEVEAVTTLTREEIYRWTNTLLYNADDLKDSSITLPILKQCVHLVSSGASETYTARFYFDKKTGDPKYVVFAV